MSIMNKGSIECGIAGTTRNIDEKAARKDKTENPYTTL
jgi:hypothetical protein